MSNQILSELLRFQQQLRILHWATTCYARHMAYGKIYGDLDSLIDDFVENSFGKHGRIDLSMNINLQDIKSLDVNEFLNSFTKILTEDISREYEKDTDLLNIRDEILGLVNKLRYLLSLK